MAGNWYPHYPGDYARKTGHLSLLEHGAYRLLLDHYYATETSLPTDVERLLRLCRATSDAERSAVLSVVKEFFVETADGWRHERADEEIEKSREKREKCSAAGQKSAAARQRTLNGRSTDVVTNRPTERQPPQPPPPNSSLRSELPKRERKARSSLPDDCPNQEDRDAALTFWRDRGRADLCGRLSDEIQAFRDHHTAKGTTSADWSASWRTWRGNAMKFNKAQTNGKRTNAHDKFLAGALAFIDECDEAAAAEGRTGSTFGDDSEPSSHSLLPARFLGRAG